MLKPKNLLHIAIFGAAIGSFGTSLDAWWHISKGRDSFFVLPHLFIHLGTLIIIAAGYFGWKKYNNRSWRNVFLTALLIPLSIPFDEIWHYFRGKETVDSVLILWSPPHLLLFCAAIGSLYLLSRLLEREKSIAAHTTFGAILFAALLNLLFIITGPFFPFSPFAFLSFYGSGVASFVLVSILLRAQINLPAVFPAVMVAIFSIVFQGIIFDSNIVYGSRAKDAYVYVPNWLFVMSQISCALLIDFKVGKKALTRGLFAGLASGLVLYVLSLSFIDPIFRFGITDAAVGVVCSGIGGALAGYVFSLNRK